MPVVDARFQKHFHVYESHRNSFEDSAPITLEFGMMRHSLQRVKKCPQHGFWGNYRVRAREGATDPEASSINSGGITSNPLLHFGRFFAPMSSQPHQPRLIPVLDVMNGRVVRAVGGQRDKYRPICCRLTGSCDPTAIARGLLGGAEADELYVADLDAITTTVAVSSAARQLLATCTVPVWLDAGIGRTDVLDFPEASNLRPVVGFETCRVWQILLETLIEPLQRRVGFSIDLRDGRLLGDWRGWGLKNDRDVLGLTRRVVEMGVGTLIVLDLARVGTGTGTGTEPLLRDIRAEFPQVDLIAGGGVRTWEDVERLGEAGASGVLVASALHDGSIRFPRPGSGARHP